ncbi:MAG TPA: SDR family oxidoreductase [Acidimicrobiales bacterium]
MTTPPHDPARDPLRLDGTVALVTGSGRGIGRATLELLRRSGAAVVGCDRLPPEGPAEPEPDPDDGFERVVDVRDLDAVDGLVAEVVERWGRLDLLVNNAGGGFAAPFMDVSAKGEAMLVAENFGQVSHLIRRVVPHMPAGGSIVNITSSEAHQAAPGYAVYAAMKAAVQSLTQSLALELAPRGIRVNAVAPDALPTPGELEAREESAAAPLPYDPAVLPPMGFFGEPADAAAAVLYLASPLARFVTGVVIHVDGGIHAAGGWHRRAPD